MLLPNRGKLLALDLGKRFTGVALTDPTQRVVFPRDEIETKDEDRLIKELKRLIEAEHVVGLVVGLPVNAEGEETQQSKWVRDILNRLQVKAPIYFTDEAYSSGTLGLEVQGRKDSLVAQKLLENYLDL